MSTSTSNPSKNAYATLLTRPSYLAGVILLAYTLHNYSPSTPLIVLYTPEDSLPKPCLDALEIEARFSNIILRKVEHVRIPKGGRDRDGRDGREDGIVAERFTDTWTKLRVFEVCGLGFEKVCFLDADMLVLRDPSPIVFEDSYWEEAHVDRKMGILATHVCVCNLDSDSWAPKAWNKENCAYTNAKTDEVPEVEAESETKGIFNSGMFVFHPSPQLADLVSETFEYMLVERLRGYQFPDQDFLNEVFRGRWGGLPWCVNALKTWRYWHRDMWRDGGCRVLHYIVDKPWAGRVVRDREGRESAGYKGLDSVTHGWWWGQWESWRAERMGDGEGEGKREVEIGERWVAKERGEGEEGNEELRAVGGGAQDFARKWGDGKPEGENAVANDDTVAGGPVLRKKMLGERGHGPVFRNMPMLGCPAWRSEWRGRHDRGMYKNRSKTPTSSTSYS
ncbi:nucleotide-diphospho-sugar transferase [Clohesyomyces aquaticus]|uniref:Nucleotide-diphospho-sugar transferase n=1 Tax=Clohesyomyces aquaticus TaxID=1231657 RepID=A0A1Y1YG15_9PLEO|nr:nucleotide-diphospho-sugar transferase [Clohesyomyces aquaticus]